MGDTSGNGVTLADSDLEAVASQEGSAARAADTAADDDEICGWLHIVNC